MDIAVRTIIDSRESRDWSQKRLAKEAGVSPKTISRLEGGEPVRPDTIVMVRRALGLPDAPQDQSPFVSCAGDHSSESEIDSGVDRPSHDSDSSVDVLKVLSTHSSRSPGLALREFNQAAIWGAMVTAEAVLFVFAIKDIKAFVAAPDPTLGEAPMFLFVYFMYAVLAAVASLMASILFEWISGYDSTVIIDVKAQGSKERINQVVHAVRHIMGTRRVTFVRARATKEGFRVIMEMHVGTWKRQDAVETLRQGGLSATVVDRWVPDPRFQ